MTKFFHIQYRPEIESGKYIVKTASGKKVRIICWDAVTQFNEPIVALVDYDGKEVAVNYTKDGRYIGNNENYLILEDVRPDPRQRWIDKVREILETTASIEKTAEALYDAAQRENYDRMLDAARSQGQEMKTYYDR